MNVQQIAIELKQLQDDICGALEALDGGAAFHEDNWVRAEGGGGRTRIIQNGALLSKGGVNFSAVHGPLSEQLRKMLRLDDGDEGGSFFAGGVSIVLHPYNPHVPIIHMNVRYFEINEQIWWFGGGIDLTPHYIVAEDARFFHQSMKNTCDKHHKDYYPKFKKWADDYFYIPHRQETRGIGGIFFDRLSEKNTGRSKEELWAFVRDVGYTFAPTYAQIANRRREQAVSEAELKWQSLRRGRYVEFNLVYDQGTKFGLESNGRIESILMSMPPAAQWVYDFTPPEGSPEAQTLSLLRKDIDWAQL